MHVWCLLFEGQVQGERIVASTVEVSRLRVVLDLDVVHVLESVSGHELLQLGVATLLHKLELLLGPHVKAQGTDHTDVDAESAMDTGAVDANEDGVAN